MRIIVEKNSDACASWMASAVRGERAA